MERLKKPYVAIFLDEESQETLLAWWKTEVGLELLPELRATHLTLKYSPNPHHVFPMGIETTIQVEGWAADDNIQAVAASSPIQSLNSHPHITMALAPGAFARHANELVKERAVEAKGPLLRGVVKIAY